MCAFVIHAGWLKMRIFFCYRLTKDELHRTRILLDQEREQGLLYVQVLQHAATRCNTMQHSRPTQSIMYGPFLVSRFQDIFLLIIQHQNLNIVWCLEHLIFESCAEEVSGNFFTYHSANLWFLCGGSSAPRSDPPHKIMRYWFYSSTLLSRSFPPDQNGQAEMICTS